MDKYKIKKDQLAYDLSIIISIIFYQILTNASGKKVFQLLSSDVSYIMCSIFLFTLSLSCGRLHLLFAKQKRNFGFFIIFVTVLLMTLPLSSSFKGHEIGTQTGLIAFFTAVAGFIIGRCIVPDNFTKTLERIVLIMLLFPISVGVILWMIQFKEGYAGPAICIFGFLGVAILGFLIDKLFLKYHKTIDTWGNSERFQRNINRLLIFIAGLTAFAVCTWEESIFSSGTTDGFYRIFTLTITGILPYRILWAFAPPVNIINAIIAISVLLINIFIVFVG